MTKPKHVWMVRSGNDNELADLVEKVNAVAIGWVDMGELSNLTEWEEFKEQYREAYPEDSIKRVSVNAGQVYRFAREIREGDYILTYIKASREILVGLAQGAYEYREDMFSPSYPHVRRVQWLKRIPRDSFRYPSRKSMGTPLTVFNLDDHLAEIHEVTTVESEKLLTSKEEDEETLPFFDEITAQANELIADLVSHLDPYDFQNLVAAVLRAMSFYAVSSPPGRDRGVDIIAHPDPLGFEQPHVKVQVKHRRDKTGGPDMRSFLGTLRPGDSGLFVSTGGFTDDATLEAEGFRQPVTLLDRDSFIRLMLEHYEALETEYKAKVSLQRVWLPTE